MKSVVEIEHLTNSYGKSRGVIDVSLKIEEGDIFGFLGPNGAGKSTTIRSMLGFLKINSGKITILGMDSIKDHEEILRNAVMSLRIHFPFYPVLGVLLAMRVSMQSMGQKTAPVISSIIELVMKVISSVWLIPRYGFVGTCVTEPVTWVLMTAFLLIIYMKKTRKRLMDQTDQ